MCDIFLSMKMKSQKCDCKRLSFKWKQLSVTFVWHCMFVMLYKLALIFWVGGWKPIDTVLFQMEAFEEFLVAVKLFSKQKS